jgi:hypothetical protein
MSQEPTVTPSTSSDAEDGEPSSVHTTANTRDVATSLHDLLKDDDEGELDVYDKMTVAGKSVWFKVINTDTDLAYRIIVDPLDD